MSDPSQSPLDGQPTVDATGGSVTEHRAAQAVPLFERALAIREAKQVPAEDLAKTRSALARAQREAKRPAKPGAR